VWQRKRYDLVLFPCERHAPHRHDDRVYLEERLMEFFEEGLAPLAATGAVVPAEGSTPGQVEGGSAGVHVIQAGGKASVEGPGGGHAAATLARL
jgi:hypothetical protein